MITAREERGKRDYYVVEIVAEHPAIMAERDAFEEIGGIVFKMKEFGWNVRSVYFYRESREEEGV